MSKITVFDALVFLMVVFSSLLLSEAGIANVEDNRFIMVQKMFQGFLFRADWASWIEEAVKQSIIGFCLMLSGIFEGPLGSYFCYAYGFFAF